MSPISIALIILAVTVILFIWEPVPIIVTAIGASIAFAYTGLIDVSDIFAGYNSTTIVLLAGMMVIGSSLFHAGITDLIGEKMVRVTGKSERNIILATLVVSCILSSVCSNIGVMTAMAPLVTAMCIAAGVGPSKALLALLFGAQFGGFVTLVGVGSNATANSVMSDLGITPFGFFSITPFGIGVCILGTLYFTFIGCRMIPDTGYVPEFAKTEKKALDKKKAAISVVTLLCVLVVIAAILTQFMSNIPSIMLFLPIGISIAEQIGVSPYPVAMTITLAGAASYATPFAAPQNMMTVGWTQYKFVDFCKIGLPMLLVTYVVVAALIPIFLPY